MAGKRRLTCSFCHRHPATIRDLTTNRPWCVGCATDTVHAGDPITYYTETDGEAYTMLLARRRIHRTNEPQDVEPLWGTPG
jgi:hypothetical protein